MFVCVCATQSIRKHALSLFSFCTPRSHAAAGRHYSVLLNKQTMERALNKQRKQTLTRTRTQANRQRRACVCVVLTLSHCARLSEREEKRAATAGSVFVCTKATKRRLLLSHSNSQPLALPALRWGEMETALRQRLRLRRRLRRRQRRRLWLWRYFSCGVHAIRNQSMSWS